MIDSLTKQNYKYVVMKMNAAHTAIPWNAIEDSFANRYASTTKQAEISSRQNALKIDDVREEEGHEYETLDQLTKRINQLVPMERTKDRDDEAKVRFLTKWKEQSGA